MQIWAQFFSYCTRRGRVYSCFQLYMQHLSYTPGGDSPGHTPSFRSGISCPEAHIFLQGVRVTHFLQLQVHRILSNQFLPITWVNKTISCLWFNLHLPDYWYGLASFLLSVGPSISSSVDSYPLAIFLFGCLSLLISVMCCLYILNPPE